MVNVTKENFLEQSNDLIQHLPTAAFVAIDEEMTGISCQSGRPIKDQTPSQRWPDLKQAPERYSIIQLGISLFHADGAENWQVRRYNFYMFPNGENNYGRSNNSMRDVVLNPSTVAFLNRHNMSFDVWTKQGIAFQTASQAQETLASFIKSQKKELQQDSAAAKGAMSAQETVRRRVELRRTEDMDFHARTMASLREWLDVSHPLGGEFDFADLRLLEAQGKTMMLPACNSFLRRALYESIGKEYPYLDLESAGPLYPNQIRVWRLTPEEKLIRKERLRQEAWNHMICHKVGMWRVFEALSRTCRGQEIALDSALFASCYNQINWDAPESILDISGGIPTDTSRRKVPLVVHNGFMDICFLLTHFHSHKLPDSLSDCKTLIRSYFPVVYDTKLVSTECSTRWRNENSNLTSLFDLTVINGGFLGRLRFVQSNNGHEGQEHEAAFDAYMTGCVYIQLCKNIRENSNQSNHVPQNAQVGRLTHLVGDNDDDQVHYLYGRNKLYQMSMYTMDLEDLTGDPLSRGMLPQSTYRVAEIDPSVSTRDIVQCLSGLHDSLGRRVDYEIIWIDDTTFLVAASYLPPPPDPAEEGEVVVATTEQEAALILQEHGHLILQALRQRFPKETIVCLVEHLESLKRAEEALNDEGDTLFGRMLRLLGLRRGKRKMEDNEGERNVKRRRIN